MKLNDEKPPNVVEVWAEDVCYEITLWWEIRPALRMARERKSENKAVSEGEVGVEAIARAVERVRGKDGGPSLEVLLRTDDGTKGQYSGSGQAKDLGLGSELVGPHNSFGTTSQRASGPLRPLGPIRLRPLLASLGRLILGCRLLNIMGGLRISCLEGLGWATEARPRPWTWVKPNWGGACPFNWSSPSYLGGPNQSMSSLWVFDGLWRPLAEKQRLEENSKTDYALMEEASRYRNAPNFFRPLVCVSPSPPSSFSGRTPSGEYYDRSGAVLDASQRESPSRRATGRESSVLETVTRWELLEDNNGAMGASGKELCLASDSFPEVRG